MYESFSFGKTEKTTCVKTLSVLLLSIYALLSFWVGNWDGPHLTHQKASLLTFNVSTLYALLARYREKNRFGFMLFMFVRVSIHVGALA